MIELSRVLTRGGKLVLCFTARASLESGLMSQGITPYDAGQVQQLMAAAGLRKVAMASAADRHRDFFCAVGYK